MGASQFFYIGGLARTSVSHNVILISCTPLLVAGHRLVIKRQRLDTRSLLGVISVASPVWSCSYLVRAVPGMRRCSGDALSLCGAISWMSATIVPAPLLAKYGTLRTSVWLLGASTLAVLPIGAFSIADSVQHPPSALAWMSLVYGGVFGILVGNSLWQRAVQEIGPGADLDLSVFATGRFDDPRGTLFR